MRQILLVEDEAQLRELMADELLDMGYGVTVAENGRVALDAVHAAMPDLILCDLAMPVMSGLDFLAAYRAETGPDRASVVILSAFGTRDEVACALDAGAVAYVRKPVDFDKLDAVLKEHVKYVATPL